MRAKSILQVCFVDCHFFGWKSKQHVKHWLPDCGSQANFWVGCGGLGLTIDCHQYSHHCPSLYSAAFSLLGTSSHLVFITLVSAKSGDSLPVASFTDERFKSLHSSRQKLLLPWILSFKWSLFLVKECALFYNISSVEHHWCAFFQHQFQQQEWQPAVTPGPCISGNMWIVILRTASWC